MRIDFADTAESEHARQGFQHPKCKALKERDAGFGKAVSIGFGGRIADQNHGLGSCREPRRASGERARVNVNFTLREDLARLREIYRVFEGDDMRISFG